MADVPKLHYILCLQLGAKSRTVTGLFTPAPGATRQTVFLELYQRESAVMQKRSSSSETTAVVFFSLEPNELPEGSP